MTWGNSDDTYFIRKTLAGDDLTSFTVELFFKPNGNQNQWARLVTGSNSSNLGSDHAYAMTFYEANKISLRGNGGVGVNGGDPVIDCSSIDVCDGKWHHAAFTVSPNALDPTKSDVTFYVDYGSANRGYTRQATTQKVLVKHADTLNLVLGTGTSGNGFNGLIDEFRISAGVLTPAQFLRAEKVQNGFTVIMR